MKDTIRRGPGLLGYAGVLPFALLATLAATAAGPPREIALTAFLFYSAVILSFLGGIRWGAAARQGSAGDSAYVVSVVPSLWAVACLAWPDPVVSAWGLALGFAVAGLGDWLRPGVGVPSWMRPLRARLTLAVLACHAAVLFVLPGI
jgi:hypothetical protein